MRKGQPEVGTWAVLCMNGVGKMMGEAARSLGSPHPENKQQMIHGRSGGGFPPSWGVSPLTS